MLPWQQWSILIINRLISCLGEMLWLRTDSRHYIVRTLAYYSKSAAASHREQPYSCAVLFSDISQQWLCSLEDLTCIKFENLKEDWYLRNDRFGIFLVLLLQVLTQVFINAGKVEEKRICHESIFTQTERPYSHFHCFPCIGSFLCLWQGFEHDYLGIFVLQLQVWEALRKTYIHKFH